MKYGVSIKNLIAVQLTTTVNFHIDMNIKDLFIILSMISRNRNRGV